MTAKHQPELTYFGIQSDWGITKHFGGRRATERLAELCGLKRRLTGKKLASTDERRVLVIGCGNGASAVHLAQAYDCRVDGVDLSPRMVDWAEQRARRRGVAERARFRSADAQALPFANSEFDAVFAEFGGRFRAG